MLERDGVVSFEFKFSFDALDHALRACDNGKHFLICCFEVGNELGCLAVHAVLQAVEAACEVAEEDADRCEADDEEADEEPAVGLTGGEISDIENLLFHAYKKSALVMS